MLKIRTACPYCFNILVHNYYCQHCYFVMKEENGIFHLHRSDDTWLKCLEQVKAAKLAEDVYIEEHKDEEGVVTPIEKRPERYFRATTQNEKMIDICMKEIGTVKGKLFLDLGGKTGWASRIFLENGAEEGAILDIEEKSMPPSKLNLTSALGDGYYMPFPPGIFDFVFDCSTLHHFEDKVALLKEIYRVLKPGGMYMSIGNPPRMGSNDDDRTRYMKTFGLIETMPKREEYESYFKDVFGSITFIPVEDNMVMHTTKGA